MKIQKYIIVLFIFLFPIISSCTKQDETTPATATETIETEINKKNISEITPPAEQVDESVETGINYISEGLHTTPKIWNDFQYNEIPEALSFLRRYERLREFQLNKIIQNIEITGIDVDLNDSGSLNKTGYQFYEQQDYAEAIRFFREAAYLDPSNTYAHYNLVCTLSLLRPVHVEENRYPTESFIIDNLYQVYDTYSYEKYDYYGYQFYPDLYFEEIYDHLTLAIIQNEKYYKKSQSDPDLAKIQKQNRFKRLISNIQNKDYRNVHGVWFNIFPETQQIELRLDQSLSFVFSKGYSTGKENILLDYNGIRNDEINPVIQSKNLSEADNWGYHIRAEGNETFPIYSIDNNTFYFESLSYNLKPDMGVVFNPEELILSSTSIGYLSKQEIINRLELENGDILYKWSDPIIVAIRNSNLEYIEGKIENLSIRKKQLLLKIACTYNKEKVIKYLIENQQISIDESKALIYASYNGSLNLVNYLISKGADVEILYNRESYWSKKNILVAAAESANDTLFFNLNKRYSNILTDTDIERKAIFSYSYNCGNAKIQDYVEKNFE